MKTNDTGKNEHNEFIAPYNQDGSIGWLVKISWYPDNKYRNRKWHSKLFAFRDYGSEDAAMSAARKYRDEWIAEHKTQRYLSDNSHRISLRLSERNSNGIVGVSRVKATAKNGPLWQCTVPIIEGKSRPKAFHINKHGEMGALKLAVEARMNGLIDYFAKKNVELDDETFEILKFYEDLIANINDHKEVSDGAKLLDILTDDAVPATTKYEKLKIRVGQQRFRREVLEYFDYKCAVTGSCILIRASHIKPWRTASDAERLDAANGLSLSPVYDAAFDFGYISFDDAGVILVAQNKASELQTLNIMGNERIGNLSDDHRKYLSWHRLNLFVGKNPG